MYVAMIQFQSIEEVKEFIYRISRIPCDFDMVDGRYTVDAKSILGIFSLELSRPAELRIHAEEEELPPILEQLAPYLVSGTEVFRSYP